MPGQGAEAQAVGQPEPQVTPDDLAGVISRVDLLSLHVSVSDTKKEELDATAVYSRQLALRALQALVARAEEGVRTRRRRGLLVALDGFEEQFLSVDEQRNNVFADGMFRKAAAHLGKITSSLGGHSHDEAVGAVNNLNGVAVTCVDLLHGEMKQVQCRSNVVRSRVKMHSCSLLASALDISVRMLKALQDKSKSAPSTAAGRQQKPVEEAMQMLRVVMLDCLGSAPALFQGVLAARKEPASSAVSKAISAVMTCLGPKTLAALQAAMFEWCNQRQVLLQFSTHAIREASRAVHAALRGLVPSAGLSASSQGQTLLLASVARGLEQLYQLDSKQGLNVVSPAEREACMQSAKAALHFAAAVMPAEMSELGRTGRSPLLKELAPQISFNMDADRYMRNRELDAAQEDVTLFLKGKKPAGQLPRLACILLARQGVQAGDWALSLSQEDSSDSDSSSQPGSPSQGPFKVFARDTDLVLAAQHAPSTLTFRE